MTDSTRIRKNTPSTQSLHDSLTLKEGKNVVNIPSTSGFLNIKGFFGRWRRIYVELNHHTLYFSMMKGGIVKKSFKLHSNTLCEDNSSRHFCFSLKSPPSALGSAKKRNAETIFLAAENPASKETWMDCIQTSLSLLRLADRKLRLRDQKKIHDEAISSYITRPLIYLKVIRARNLAGKDANGFSDPYVKITLGSSNQKTTTRKRNLNPDWGMVFSFDWDLSMRYIKIEVWDEDITSTHDFLGTCFIPIFSFSSGYNR
jgi:hypothetical protein